MSKIDVSVIIPARNERFLANTINDVLSKASTSVEILAVLDGYWPNPPLTDDPRLIQLHRGRTLGMRNAINSAAAVARGEYLFKLDAHCMVAEGWDVALQADCDQDWVVVPRRKRLDAENWQIQDVGKPDVDYMYLSFPDDPDDFGGPGLNGKNWDAKNRDPKLKDILIDDLMSAQGSGWFMTKRQFEALELMDEAHYGSFWNEFQEIGLKCWLSGGRVVVNKKTWYAHLHKGKKYGRGYVLDHSELGKGATFTKNWFHFGRAWEKQILPIQNLIERFAPVPGWPENWESIIYGNH